VGVNAAPWSGIIDPTRAIDWSQAGVPGGIPNRTTVCATLGTAGQASSFAQSVTAAQINSAIAACPANQVVLLNAGTYNLSSGINIQKDNVTLRGVGADKTILKFSGGVSCNGLGAFVCIIGDAGWSQLSPGNTANWTAGYAQGTTVLTFSSVANLSPGKLVMLDQLSETTDDGSVFNCQKAGLCEEQGTDIGRANRAQHQMVQVVSISGTQVTVTPGLHMPNWRSSQSPGAWWSSSQPRVGVGIEDLSLDYTAGGTKEEYGMQTQDTWGCWVKGIRSINGNNAHINQYLSSHMTVRDSYFYGTQNACTQSYGMEPWMSGDNLYENNIFQHVASAYVMSGGHGSVMSYSYIFDDYFHGCGDNAWFQGALYSHESSSNYNLWESNNAPGLNADQIHGSSNFGTVFRNRLDGKDPLNSDNKTDNTYAIGILSFSRYWNILGNVLGTTSYYKSYESFTGGTAACDVAIYELGWGGNCNNASNSGDPNVRTTMYRWGNYDTVNNAVRWVASEVPSSLSLYANSVPASQTLPASLYMTSQPAWWTTPFGTPSWPAIGPDVSGGNVPNVGGHTNKIPAQLCSDSLSADPAFAAGSVKLFNADACYGSGTVQTPSVCDVNESGSTNVADVQLAVNQAIGVTTCTADIDKDGACNVADVQRVVNAALGGSCVTQ
jgi:hypothetical protein